MNNINLPDEYGLDLIIKSVEVLHSIIGKKWFEKRANNNFQNHPLARYYFAGFVVGKTVFHAQDKIDHRQPGTPAPIIYDLPWQLLHDYSSLIRAAATLKAVQNLPNFETRILPDLTNQAKGAFDVALFEADVAHLCLTNGYDVEFLPPAPTKKQRHKSSGQMPDLLLKKDSVQLYAECKRKDNFVYPAQRFAPEWDEAIRKINDLLEETGRALEVQILAGQEFETKMIAPAIRHVETLLASGDALPQNRADKSAGFVLVLRENNRSASSESSEAVSASPGKVNRVTTSIPATGDDQNARPNCRTELWAFDSHRLKSLVSSFDVASEQIPKGSDGVIYLRIDISNIPSLRTRFEYTWLADAIINRNFASGFNSRVAAVVTMGLQMEAVINPRTGLQQGSFTETSHRSDNPHSAYKGDYPWARRGIPTL